MSFLVVVCERGGRVSVQVWLVGGAASEEAIVVEDDKRGDVVVSALLGGVLYRGVVRVGCRGAHAARAYAKGGPGGEGAAREARAEPWQGFRGAVKLVHVALREVVGHGGA